MNQATNVLNAEQTSLLVRKAMLEALPTIIAAASKPMEQIDKITILDARGLHGETAGPDGTGPTGNLADAAVSAAMKYRVGGPLIDTLMAELGMAGSGVGGLLSGATSSAPNLPESAENLKSQNGEAHGTEKNEDAGLA